MTNMKYAPGLYILQLTFSTYNQKFYKTIFVALAHLICTFAFAHLQMCQGGLVLDNHGAFLYHLKLKLMSIQPLCLHIQIDKID